MHKTELCKIKENNVAKETKEVYEACREIVSKYQGKRNEFDQYNESERNFFIMISDFFLGENQKEMIKKGIF